MDSKTELISLDRLEFAAELLQKGEIVAFPTETVYGLGACLFLEQAVRKIFQAKKRPHDNPLIAHIGSLDHLADIAVDIPAEFYQLMEAFFPGPLTLVVRKHPKVPSIISAGLPTIAIRMPNHPVAQRLIELTGQPIVAPSANLSGKPSATSYEHVVEDFNGVIPGIVMGGKTELGIESTVVSLLEGKAQVLRPGSITKEQIEAVIKKPVSLFHRHKDDGALPSPGMKYRHYAPEAKVLLFYSWEETMAYVAQCANRKCIVLSRKKPSFQCEFHELSPASLYACLRLSDQIGCKEVIVFCDEEIRNDVALMNRLLKASEK
jgi:L-threonylcarbamoyladenylate synthase